MDWKIKCTSQARRCLSIYSLWQWESVCVCVLERARERGRDFLCIDTSDGW
jgi:hypothetical protein